MSQLYALVEEKKNDHHDHLKSNLCAPNELNNVYICRVSVDDDVDVKIVIVSHSLLCVVLCCANNKL